MAAVPVIFDRFDGGWSTDSRIGPKYSQAFTQGLDFRKSPSQLTALPRTAREDGGTVKDLILNEVMTSTGDIYAFGNGGFIYQRSPAGNWSSIGSMNFGTGGVDWRHDTDSIYFTSNKYVGVYAPLSATPTLTSRKYGDSYSTLNNSNIVGFNVAAFQQGSTQTTAIGTTILESQATLRYFQSDIEPLDKISVYVVSKGSGDWTLTLHDGDNNVMASATVANASLMEDNFNDFVFSSSPNGQVRIYVQPNARTYHIHVTSTVADGTISSTEKNNMSTCDLEVWADRLIVTRNGLHPMVRFQQYEVFGNSNYVSIWEPISDPPTNAEWIRHRLTVPSEYECCGLTTTNEFLVAAFEQPITTANSTPQAGLIIYWDGTSATYNYFYTVPEGSPQAIRSYKNTVYYVAGGALWSVVPPSTNPVKVWQFPNTFTEYSSNNVPITVYPYTGDVRRNVLVQAYPSVTTNTNLMYGVYSYGAVDKNYADSFGYSYAISTGSQNYSVSNNLQIGMIKTFGDIMHISWRDTLNGGFGVDVVSNTSLPAATASWQSLIVDNGDAGKPKTANYLEVYMTGGLPAGSTIQLKYAIDGGDWVQDENIYSSTNLWQGVASVVRFDIGGPGGLFYEIQLGFDLTCTTSTPVIGSIKFVYDNQVESRNR